VRSTAILAVWRAGILPADDSTSNLQTRRDARLPHRQDACATLYSNFASRLICAPAKTTDTGQVFFVCSACS
jgi:hypothetical protein